MPVYCSRIARRIRLAENVNGIARLEVTSAESHVGVEREIGDREHSDRVKSPGRDAFHQLNTLLREGALKKSIAVSPAADVRLPAA